MNYRTEDEVRESTKLILGLIPFRNKLLGTY